MPLQLKMTANQLIVAWSFAHPFLARRAAASAPLWDDALVQGCNTLFNNADFVKLLERVMNGEKKPEALQLEAPAAVRMEARQFAGNMEFVTGWLRDIAGGLQDAEHVTPAVDCEVASEAESKLSTGEFERVAAARAAGPESPRSQRV